MTADSGTYDDATQVRRRMAAALLGQTLKPEENVKHWAQGLANLAKAGIGGYMGYQANQEAAAEKAKGQAELYTALGLPAPAAPAESPGMFSKIGSLLSGGGNAAPEVAAPAGPVSDQAVYPPPPAAPPAPTTFRPGITAPAPAAAPDYSKAIAGIESGGAYDKLGPQTKTGDRAYGKYQVMGANIPEWTTQVLGKPMTPEQFLANPDAQEAVFKAKFGNYVEKYGPEGAAKAWFAGEKGMNNPGAKDVLGTTVAGYADKFNRGLGAAPQIASALTAPSGDAALPPGAAPAQGALPTAEAVKGTGVLADVPQDKKRQIAQMLTSSNPTVKALGMSMVQQMTKPEITDEIKEYNLDSAQRKARGEQPLSFFDFKAGLKKAGATNVSVDASQKGENKFEEKASSLQAERFDKIVQGGSDAKSMVSDLQSLRDIGTRVATGKTAEVKAALGPYAEALGVKIDGLDDLQAFKAITSRLAPQMRVPGSGATSDFEMRTFLEGLPGLGKTPEGNELISKTLEAMAQHKIAAAEIASKAINGEIKRKDADKMLRELPDPLALWKQTRGEMKPQAEPKTAPAVPQPGEIRDGYRFKGGNPADQKNWEQIS